MLNHLLCFGYGYVAKALSADLATKDWNISCTLRTTSKQPSNDIGINSYIFEDIPEPSDTHDLHHATHALISIPPNITGDPVYKRHLKYIETMPKLKWVGYLSTTGVYGDTGGDWVNESSPTNPTSQRSSWRVKAEDAWLSTNLPVHIFRLSSIYGAERNALSNVINGTAKRIKKEGQFFSRIHIKDICNVLVSSMERPNPKAIYNCSDDLPTSQEEVVAYASRLLKSPPLPLIRYEDADLSDMSKSFYQNSRKVDNDKIKRELGIKLQFPDYVSGLNDIYKTHANIN